MQGTQGTDMHSSLCSLPAGLPGHFIVATCQQLKARLILLFLQWNMQYYFFTAPDHHNLHCKLAIMLNADHLTWGSSLS